MWRTLIAEFSAMASRKKKSTRASEKEKRNFKIGFKHYSLANGLQYIKNVHVPE
jgi:hypothetical protein